MNTLRDDDTGPVQAGMVLAERYRLLQVLGTGGMGSVWAAEHTELGTPVAVKVIRVEHEGGERARARFVREARSAASLRGPHVVQIFDYGVHDGTPYIAMERLDGVSLAEHLREHGPLSPSETWSIVAQVGRAIERAHEAGIVHRDLKPANVFVRHDQDGVHCKVLDFGIASGPPMDGVHATTVTGATLGTPHYMSPEQARDAADADARSDLWSLAVIAYECLVGARPFIGDSLPALTVKILVDPIPVPSEHADVPAAFDAWFAKATERDRQQRFQTARALSVALATALGVTTGGLQSVEMTSESALPALGRGGAMGRAALFVLLLGAAGIAAGVAAWMAARSTAPPTEHGAVRSVPDGVGSDARQEVLVSPPVDVAVELPSAPVVELPEPPVPAPTRASVASKPKRSGASSPPSHKPDLGDLEF